MTVALLRRGAGDQRQIGRAEQPGQRLAGGVRRIAGADGVLVRRVLPVAVDHQRRHPGDVALGAGRGAADVAGLPAVGQVGPGPVLGVQHDPLDVDAAGLDLGRQVGHQRRTVVHRADAVVARGQRDVAAADQHDVALLVALDDLGDEPAGRIDRGQQGRAGQQLRGRGRDLRRVRVLVPQHRPGRRIDDDAGELREFGVGQLRRPAVPRCRRWSGPCPMRPAARSWAAAAATGGSTISAVGGGRAVRLWWSHPGWRRRQPHRRPPVTTTTAATMMPVRRDRVDAATDTPFRRSSSRIRSCCSCLTIFTGRPAVRACIGAGDRRAMIAAQCDNLHGRSGYVRRARRPGPD